MSYTTSVQPLSLVHQHSSTLVSTRRIQHLHASGLYQYRSSCSCAIDFPEQCNSTGAFGPVTVNWVPMCSGIFSFWNCSSFWILPMSHKEKTDLNRPPRFTPMCPQEKSCQEDVSSLEIRTQTGQILQCLSYLSRGNERI